MLLASSCDHSAGVLNGLDIWNSHQTPREGVCKRSVGKLIDSPVDWKRTLNQTNICCEVVVSASRSWSVRKLPYLKILWQEVLIFFFLKSQRISQGLRQLGAMCPKIGPGFCVLQNFQISKSTSINIWGWLSNYDISLSKEMRSKWNVSKKHLHKNKCKSANLESIYPAGRKYQLKTTSWGVSLLA